MDQDSPESVSSEVTDNTPVVEESASQPESSGAEQQDAAPEKTPEERPAPFHEHPRFKELIEQNRSFKTQAEEYQRSLQTLQAQMEMLRQQAAPKKEEPVDPFLADLEKINPAYAKSLKSVYERAAKAEQIEQRLQQYESQQFAQKAYSRFDNLLSTAKVQDEVDKDVYRAAVEAEVYRRESRGEKLNLEDLDKIFNSFHTRYSKAREDMERKITAKYVSDKKSDATPSPVTGGAATSPTMKKFSSVDAPETVKWLAEELRKSKKTI